jgi:hypothetical protein
MVREKVHFFFTGEVLPGAVSGSNNSASSGRGQSYRTSSTQLQIGIWNTPFFFV